MKVSSIQMNMKLGDVDANFAHAAELICRAAEGKPDVVLLPETWNTGFFPTDGLKELCDADGARVKAEIGALARRLKINIVAGSVSNVKRGKIYNTSYVFDRQGGVVAEYDKVHLFTPMAEHQSYAWGDHTSVFQLDDARCGVIICYDIRFPELIRTMTLKDIDVLFVVAQWPSVRIPHLTVLSEARAIENQVFLALCNSCGTAGKTQYGGNSSLINPWGETLARAGKSEEIISADFDLSVIRDIRNSINVFRDRRPGIYSLGDFCPRP